MCASVTDSVVHHNQTQMQQFVVFFSTVAMKKTSTITQKNTVVISVVRQAGHPALFTCGPYVHVDVITPHCARQAEGCGRFEMHQGEAPAPTS